MCAPLLSLWWVGVFFCFFLLRCSIWKVVSSNSTAVNPWNTTIVAKWLLILIILPTLKLIIPAAIQLLSVIFPISLYPEITSDTQRHEYKKEFDSDLRTYKELCAEMDDINDQINKLSRELDALEEGSSKYQVSDWKISDYYFTSLLFKSIWISFLSHVTGCSRGI